VSDTKNPAANYVDLGLDYKGGPSYPFFVSGKSNQDGDNINFGLTVTLNKSTNAMGVKLVATSSGTDKGTMNADFTIKPSNTPVSVKAPTGSITLAQALDKLGLGDVLQTVSQYSTGQNQAKDAKRQADIMSLQTQLEAYFTQTGNYPTLSEMNDASWLKGNMSSLDINGTMMDPDGSTAKLAAKPAPKVYAYQPTDDSGSADACAAAASQCTKYTLTATLSDGSTDVVQNLD
jgi:hypothetical protein